LHKIIIALKWDIYKGIRSRSYALIKRVHCLAPRYLEISCAGHMRGMKCFSFSQIYFLQLSIGPNYRTIQFLYRSRQSVKMAWKTPSTCPLIVSPVFELFNISSSSVSHSSTKMWVMCWAWKNNV